MSIEAQTATHIQVENVSDYTHYITQVTDAVVTFVDQPDDIQVDPDQTVSSVTHDVAHAVSQSLAHSDVVHAVTQSFAHSDVAHAVTQSLAHTDVAHAVTQSLVHSHVDHAVTQSLEDSVVAQAVTHSLAHSHVDHAVTQSLADSEIAHAVTQSLAHTHVAHAVRQSLEDNNVACAVTQSLAHNVARAVVFEQLTEEASDNIGAVISPPAQTTIIPQAEIHPPVGKGPFRCETCDKLFHKWNQLQRHMKSHEEDKPHRCNHCNTSFNVKNNLKLHLATHLVEDQEPTCPECGKKFSRIASLKAHIMLHEKEESLMCAECGDEFSLQSQLDKHMQEHREEQEGSRTYACRQCTHEFPKLALLRNHMKQHYRIKSSLSHRSYKRNIDRSSFHHKCQHCGKSFQKPSQLERHVRIHTGERPFACPICDKSFNQKGALQIHMTKHTGERPHMCEFCSATFSQKGNLRAHIQRVHSLTKDSDSPAFQCEECSCVFRKLGSLNAHISRAHSEPTELPTQVEVRRVTDNDKSLSDTIHQLLELSEPVQPGTKNGQLLQGDQGSQNSNSQADAVSAAASDILQQALQNSGLPSVTMAGGEQGSTSVTTTTPSQAITMTVHDSATGATKKHIIRKVNGVRWHQCTYCTKEFKKPSDLVRHIRIHTHEKPYKCNQCYRAFAVKSTLTAHLKTHTGVKDYKCHVCSKMFSTHGSLKVHLRLHTGAKPFECTHCDKKFRTSAHQKSHSLSHFKDSSLPRKPRRNFRRSSKPDIPLPDIPLQEPILITDTGLIQQPPRNSEYNPYLNDANSTDRPYKCTYCQRGFKKSSHLKQHIRSHTGEKPYKCLQCMRSFVSSGVLKSHIRTHTGLKAYKCPICHRTFTTSGSLKRHMSTHTEVRPFMCPYCQKTFKTSVNCKKHMKTHRHELAMQAVQQQQQEQANDGAPLTDHCSDTDITQADGVGLTQGQAADLASISQQDHLSHVASQDLSQSAGVLSQATIQDALNTTALDQQLQQTLSQQVFGQQTTLGQSLLGGQQNFAQIGAFSNSQFSMSTQQLTNAIDVGSLNSSFTTNLTSTPMQTILQTREPQLTPAQQQRQATIQREVEEGKRSYKCIYCGKGFKKSSHLKQHIRSHTGEKPYKCLQCGRMFVSTGVLKAHLKTHSGVKDYKCHVCHATFTTNGSLTRHMMIHSSIRPFKCPYCIESFRTVLHWKRHMRMHKEEESENEDEMVQTPKRTRTAVIQITEEQAAELSKTDPDEEMTISEKILIESASEKDRISEIKDKCTELEKLPKHQHHCPQCPKTFKKPSDLVRHIRIHTGEKPFACDLCQRSFTVKSTLDSHMKTHGSGEKRFKCHVCTAPFSTKGSLKVHMRLHTGAKPFKCPHCDHQFRTSGHRKSHILSHFKTDAPKKRKTPSKSVESPQPVVLLNTTEPQALTTNQTNVANQVISIDQNLVQNQTSLIPVSLTVSDNYGQLTESALAAHVLQGLEGIQLHLTGNLGQGIQITGLDPSVLSQTVQIDASLLHQLQQQGNVNITINPNIITQATDPGLMSSIQIQPVAVQDIVNPNVIVQPMSTIAVAQPTDQQQTLQTAVTMQNGQNGEHNFIVTASNGDSKVAGDPVGEVQDSETTGITVENSTPLEQNPSDSLPEASDDDQDSDLDQESENLVAVAEGNSKFAADPERTHVCQYCQKSFKRSSHLKEHLLIHALTSVPKIKATPHKCDTCGKAFQKPSQLERHIRIHTGERPYICAVCEKAFNQKNALQVHLKKHSGEKPHKCPYCELAFIQKGNLKTHIKRAHHVEMVQSMNLPRAVVPPAGATVSVTTEGTAESVPEEGLDLEDLFTN